MWTGSENIRRLLEPIERLALDPANARKHTQKSQDALKGSLARFGQTKPIVVDPAGVVRAGNGTLTAARSLGWTHIAVARPTLSEAEWAAYAIADNRIAELSEWDEQALASVLGGLDADLQGVTGFDAKQLAGILPHSDLEGEQAPERPAVPVSRLGDLWLLGEHRLLCGDCTKADYVQRVMGGQRAVLFATDPPYLVGYTGTNHPSKKDWSDTYGVAWDDADDAANADLYDRFIKAAVEHAIGEHAAWYCWHASRRQAMLEQAWQRAGAFVHCQIVWTKNRPAITHSWYSWGHEPCFMGWKQGHKPKRCDATVLSTVWQLNVIDGDERPDHPTPKPLECFAIPMRQHTEPADVVYEPFSGSGTQIIVAEQLGRRCCAIDIEPAYIDVAVERWQQLTGKEARLESGETWSQTRAARAGV